MKALRIFELRLGRPSFSFRSESETRPFIRTFQKGFVNVWVYWGYVRTFKRFLVTVCVCGCKVLKGLCRGLGLLLFFYVEGLRLRVEGLGHIALLLCSFM